MSIGPLQIQSKYHEDAWQGREPYTRCEEVPHAEETAVRWWMTHVPWALEFGDLEAMARSHNGGPHFSKAHKTGRYWQKVRRELGSASAYRTGRMAPPGNTRPSCQQIWSASSGEGAWRAPAELLQHETGSSAPGESPKDPVRRFA